MAAPVHTENVDRERGEAYLRLLAEAELRAGHTDADLGRMRWVAQALNSVRALETGTAEAIIADHAVALGSRRRSYRGLMLGEPPPLPHGPWGAPWFTGPAGAGSPDQGGPDRLMPLGLTIRHVHDRTERELHLLSYSRTAAGAWFVIAWVASPSAASSGNPLPFGPIQITDDRGTRYSSSFSGAGGSDPVGHLALHPDPVDDIQWFELALPGSPALRIGVNPDGPPDDICPQVRETSLSAGEHFLNRSAELLLVSSLRYSSRPRRWPDDLVTWLGDVIAALEAAGALSPVSPVPGQIAALCARLGITRHGITAPPARCLPQPWLSLLGCQHKKPDPPPAWDGFAAVAAALPELNGITLTLLGVLSLGAKTVLYLRASGYGGPAGSPDQEIPLSVWVRASDGRWYATKLDHWSNDGRDHMLTLHLVPPLPTFAAWIELLAAGPSAEVSARLPLRWQ
jgi:hypothetical protein